MKYYFPIIVLFAVASCSTEPHAIDWVAIELNLELIRNGTFTTGIAAMKEVASTDNPEIGRALAIKLDAAAAQVGEILDDLTSSINGQNLTSTDAELICANFTSYIEHQSISDEIDLLSPRTRMEVLYAFYVPGHFDIYKCHEIIWLLDERPRIPTNWTTLDLELTHIAQRGDDGASYVKDVAINDDYEIGVKISPVIDTVLKNVKTFIENTRLKISNQSLNLTEAINYAKEIHSQTYYLYLDIYEDVSQLSFAPQVYIEDAFYYGLEEVYYSGVRVANAIAGGHVIPDGRKLNVLK